MDLHWVVPDFRPGSGGHTTIFRMMHRLEGLGHRNTLWIMHPHQEVERARQTLRDAFFPLEAEVRELPEDPSDIRGDAVVATEWRTAYPVRFVRNVRARFYLVQDYEPSFFPMGADHIWSLRTYHFGFSAVSIGPWLADRLAAEFGLDTDHFDFAADTDVYSTEPRVRRLPDRVAFYARSETERRAVDLGLMALELASERLPNLVVELFGHLGAYRDLAFPARQRGILHPRELADLYRRAAVGMTLSTTNPSLVPFEMMACGLPVIDLDLDPVNATLSTNALTRAEPDPTALAEALVALLSCPRRRERQAKAAFADLAARSWARSGRQLEAILQRRIADSVS